MLKRTIFLVAIVLFVCVAMSFAQNVSENTEESSETGSMQLVYSRADATAKCGAIPAINLSGAPYAPKFQSSVKSYSRFETYGLALMCMQTSLPQYRANNGIGWVLTADQSQVGFTAERMAYYLGTADGQYKRCHNTVYAIAVAQKQEESWTPTQKPQQQTNINVSANANANATAIAKTEVCKPKSMEYIRTDTVRGREFEIYSNGCQEFPREVVAETKAELCPEGTLRNERTGQCVKPEKGDSWWVRGGYAAAGAGGMYVACRIWKFCGTKKVYTNGTIPTKGPGRDGKEPGITPGTRTRTDGTGRVIVTGSSNGTGTVGSRRRAGTNTFVQQVAPYQSGARTRSSNQAQPNRSYSTNTSGCANLITVNGRRVCAN